MTAPTASPGGDDMAAIPATDMAAVQAVWVEGRMVHEQSYLPFAEVGGVVLVHPSSRVERIGFHESNNEGARALAALPRASAPTTLATRARGTDPRTAADVVVDPETEIRAPVSGRVLRSGGYTLYCAYRDHFVVIEPDAHPGWEVKILHLRDSRVRAGQRVEAGVTVLAGGPNRLPFVSQVDAVTASPAWPHVHLEVVDPSIPDIPGSGGC